MVHMVASTGYVRRFERYVSSTCDLVSTGKCCAGSMLVQMMMIPAILVQGNWRPNNEAACNAAIELILQTWTLQMLSARNVDL